MEKTENLTDKLSKEQKQHFNSLLSAKLQKIKLFVSNSDEDFPTLTSQLDGTNKVATQLRMYFNDQELLIFKDYMSPKSYFQEEQFETKIEVIFNDFIKDNPRYVPQKQAAKEREHNQFTPQKQEQKQKPLKQPIISHKKHLKIDFIQFLQYWFAKQEQLKVFYEKYDQVIKSSVDTHLDNLYRVVSKSSCRQVQTRQQSDLIGKIQKQIQERQAREKQSKKFSTQQSPSGSQHRRLRTSSAKKAIQGKAFIQITNKQGSQTQAVRQPSQKSIKSHPMQQQQAKSGFHCYMRKYYDHYCKKALNTIKDVQFQKVGNFYTSMNLTKFMMYCKDLKLLKMEKKVTAKYLQQLFKLNQNKMRSLDYDSFVKVVAQVLANVYRQSHQLQTDGYSFIGVKNRQNFVQTMGRLGVIVPLKKVLFTKSNQGHALSRMAKSRAKQQPMKSSKPLPKQSPLLPSQIKNGGYGHGYQSNWGPNKLQPEPLTNQRQRKQQKLLQSLTVPKLNKLQPSRQIEQKLQQIIDEDYDPYLKRYNDRYGSSHKHDHSASTGVMKRIDDRINNMVKKIR